MLTIVLAFLAYALVGAIAGLLAGLLGIGGGVVTVPCLFFLFHFLGYPQAYVMHMAIGTSLAAMVFNTLSSTWAHNQKKAVAWDVVKKMLFGIILGSILGAICADFLSGVILEIIFGIFLVILGFFFFRHAKPHVAQTKLPSQPILTLISAGIGWVSNILGIGGGIFTVPTLTAFKMPRKDAIGTGAAISCLISALGAFSYLVLGLNELPISDTVGFINLPAFMVVGIVSFFSAPYGAKLTHQLPDLTLKRIFGVVLILTGCSILI